MVVDLVPEMKDQFAPYLAARTAEDREFAAVFILLHAPGFEPIVLTGLGRLGPDGRESPLTMGSYGGNWWCSLAPSRPGSGYSNQGCRPGFEGVLSQVGQASPEFLTAEEKDRAAKEWDALSALPSAPNWLIGQTFAWAKTHTRIRVYQRRCIWACTRRVVGAAMLERALSQSRRLRCCTSVIQIAIGPSRRHIGSTRKW